MHVTDAQVGSHAPVVPLERHAWSLAHVTATQGSVSHAPLVVLQT